MSLSERGIGFAIGICGTPRKAEAVHDVIFGELPVAEAARRCGMKRERLRDLVARFRKAMAARRDDPDDEFSAYLDLDTETPECDDDANQAARGRAGTPARA